MFELTVIVLMLVFVLIVLAGVVCIHRRDVSELEERVARIERGVGLR